MVLGRRLIADGAGLLTAVCATLAVILAFRGTHLEVKNWAFGVEIVLCTAAVSYISWTQIKGGAAVYLKGLLATVAVGFLSLSGDYSLAVRPGHPNIGVVESILSSPFFIFTLFACPFLTIVLLSGLVRALLLRHLRPPID